MFFKKVLFLAHNANFVIHEMLRSIVKPWPKVLRRSMCMSFFVMPYTFTVVGRFKMVQTAMSLSSNALHICPSTLLRTMSLSNGTFLERPWTGLCFGLPWRDLAGGFYANCNKSVVQSRTQPLHARSGPGFSYWCRMIFEQAKGARHRVTIPWR